MIRQWFSRFMAGRYGMDQLSSALITIYVILYVIYFFTGWMVLEFLVMVLMLVALFRVFSRKIEARRAENTKFLQLTRPLARRFQTYRNRAQDKDHRYFKCPNCGQQMRVPKGKGRITVHCRSCGATFEEKS